MLSFAFRGSIAEVDDTVPGDPHHPSVVLVVETNDDLCRVSGVDNAVPWAL